MREGRGSFRALVGLVAAVLLLAGLALYAARVSGSGWLPAVLAVSFASLVVPFLGLAALLLLVLLVRPRRRLAVGLALLVAVAALVPNALWYSDRWTRDGPAASRTPFAMLSLNTNQTRADPAAVVDLVRSQQVRVVVLIEVTPAYLRRLARAGLDDLLPHHVLRAPGGVLGVAVFSRDPLGTAQPLRVSYEGISVPMGMPGLDRPLTIVAGHTIRPNDSVSGWTRDLRSLGRAGARARRVGPVVVAGDLNATLDHDQLRDVLGPFRDAADAAGSGYQPTWPSDGQLHPLGIAVPSLITIDHQLLSPDVAVDSTRAVQVRGTDHRGLLSRLSTQ